MDKNIIFIWIPKTAGTSIWSHLVKQGNSVDKLWIQPDKFKNQKIVTFGHISIPSLLSQGIMSAYYFNNSFKFAFVRNPWDRLVSLYYYFRSNRTYKKRYISTIKDFDFFCKNLHVPTIGFYNVKGLSQCNNQADWLLDKDGRLLVDFIGRFENLQEDYKKVCDIIGLKPIRLPHLKKTKRYHYSVYYNKETKQIIADRFKKDIGMFNYDFEKSTS